MSPASVVVDTSASPYARLRPVPVSAVTLDDRLWALLRRLNRYVALPYQHRQCEDTGRLDNFRRAAGQKMGDFQGYFFNDSDVYKLLEAACWALPGEQMASTARLVDDTIALVAAAQGEDGYLNTFFSLERAGERWSNLFFYHELYCAGHLIQAAVAHQRVTGQDGLLAVARRFADLICDTFGPESAGKKPGADGHPQIEMALVELYRLTGERRYLDQAAYFLDARGHGLLNGAAYCQDDVPFRERTRLGGHAVRALYLCAGAADLYAETGEAALRESLERQWAHMVARQMYVTGGLGARHEGESFGDDYELPNASAYAETCAAIASVMWNWRMLLLDGQARYADLIEHTLYNAVLPGLGLDGQHYFYVNPLADDGGHRRQPWFDVACCPTNLARLLAALPGCFYSVSERGLWLHLYAQHDARLTLPDGRDVALAVRTRYPWEGDIRLEITQLAPPAQAAEPAFSLFLRVPAWCEQGAALSVNGQPFAGEVTPGAYVEIRRAWQPGDQAHLALPMAARQIEAHPRVLENAGRVALARGPVVYCVEAADNPDTPLDSVVLTGDSFESPLVVGRMGGMIALRAAAALAPPEPAWTDRLYRARPAAALGAQDVFVTAIPYFAWANREPGAMRIWLRAR